MDRAVLSAICKGILRAFAGSLCSVSGDDLPLDAKAYDPVRRQYISTKILSDVSVYAGKTKPKPDEIHRVVGVTDGDLYVTGLNFVFGEAECPGKAALISLARLTPQFYAKPRNETLVHERAVKEAVHELGHTLGIRHCTNPLCVMHFSLHIGMTDRKRESFCKLCLQQVNRALPGF